MKNFLCYIAAGFIGFGVGDIRKTYNLGHHYTSSPVHEETITQKESDYFNKGREYLTSLVNEWLFPTSSQILSHAGRGTESDIFSLMNYRGENGNPETSLETPTIDSRLNEYTSK